MCRLHLHNYRRSCDVVVICLTAQNWVGSGGWGSLHNVLMVTDSVGEKLHVVMASNCQVLLSLSRKVCVYNSIH